MPMEFDHYYTQRDELHPFPSSSFAVSRPFNSTRNGVMSKKVTSFTSPSSSTCSLGKIRIPPLCQRKLDHELILGDPYELEDYDKNDEQVDSFLESIALGTPRRVAGSKRVMRAQMMRQKMGIHPDQMNLASGCSNPPEAQAFQSISAISGLRGASFEEYRTDCYSQSNIATGKPPLPCAQPCGSSNGTRLIPPSFRPFMSPNPQQEMNLGTDVVMSDA
ncbi:hypothetical protein L218DRAFT_395954 [Marasmius fiardii PR-910]|nr:hypothetical protein L218DRAFT_395954 [Marasmius fiardii PR-910]